MTTCELCDHALIDHGDYPEDPCDCCSGRTWLKTQPSSGYPKEEEKRSGRDDGRIPRGFVIVKEFPDYMISKQGTVKHIPTGKFCFLVRISATGGAMISLRKNGKTHTKSVQELRARAFPEHFSA